MNQYQHQLRKYKSAALIGIVVGGTLLATYPVIIKPYMNPDPWQKVQKKSREGMDRESIQPGGMKVWSDPFDRTKETK